MLRQDSHFYFIGLSIFSGSNDQVLARFIKAIQENKRIYICVTSAHGIVESYRHRRVYKAHKNASLIVPDGMSLVWMGKLFGYTNTERIYGPGLMDRLCQLSRDNGYRIFLYGTDFKTLSLLKAELRLRYPGIHIVGSISPPFRSLTHEESITIVNKINRSKPHILFVGLSTPKQEIWMHEYRKLLNVNILIGVGAAFDFIAGTTKQAPQWMQVAGLEWLFRLFKEPRRLFMRYAATNSIFLVLCMWYLIIRVIKVRNKS